MSGSERKKQSEKYVERKLTEAVEGMDGLAIKMALTGSAGFPDRLILLPGGHVAFVECKTTGEKPRKLQKWWMDRLTRKGFLCTVLDHTDDIPELLEIIEHA